LRSPKRGTLPFAEPSMLEPSHALSGVKVATATWALAKDSLSAFIRSSFWVSLCEFCVRTEKSDHIHVGFISYMKQQGTGKDYMSEEELRENCV